MHDLYWQKHRVSHCHVQKTVLVGVLIFDLGHLLVGQYLALYGDEFAGELYAVSGSPTPQQCLNNPDGKWIRRCDTIWGRISLATRILSKIILG